MGNILSHTRISIGFLPGGYAGHGYPLPSLFGTVALTLHEDLCETAICYGESYSEIRIDPFNRGKELKGLCEYNLDFFSSLSDLIRIARNTGFLWCWFYFDADFCSCASSDSVLNEA